MNCWITAFVFFVLGEIVGLILMGLIKERVTGKTYLPCTEPYDMDEPLAWYQPRVDPDREPIDPSTLEDIPKFLRRQAD